VIYGLLAAMGWGTSAVAAAVAVRRARTFQVVLLSQALGLAALLLLAVLTRRTLGVITLPVAFGLAGAGLIGLVGYLTFYRSVALGPAGLMSAISSTYGGVAAGLAVGLLGEHLGALGIAGIVLAICGVALASARGQNPQLPNSAPHLMIVEGFTAHRRKTLDDHGNGAEGQPRSGEAGADGRLRSREAGADGRPRAGEAGDQTGGRAGTPFSPAAIPLALGSALAYGVSGFVLGYFTKQSGWVLSGAIAHTASVAALLAALPLAGGVRGFRERSGAPILAWAAAAGLADAVGLLAFSRGSELGMVAVTAATSSTYPVIPLIAGVVLLGERLGRRQLTGIALIIGGLVLLGLA
jgi:drug/metabolite transporter (DMT)-like permease